jgi:phenylacetaldehyde dehydrogenase
MDTIELDPRLRHATTFLGRAPKMLIDGKMVSAASGKTFEVYNPATGAVIANVPEGEGRCRSRGRRGATRVRRWAVGQGQPV